MMKDLALFLTLRQFGKAGLIFLSYFDILFDRHADRVTIFPGGEPGTRGEQGGTQDLPSVVGGSEGLGMWGVFPLHKTLAISER